MRRYVYRARAAVEEPPPGPTLNQVIAAAVDEANRRMWAAGRKECGTTTITP